MSFMGGHRVPSAHVTAMTRRGATLLRRTRAPETCANSLQCTPENRVTKAGRPFSPASLMATRHPKLDGFIRRVLMLGMVWDRIDHKERTALCIMAVPQSRLIRPERWVIDSTTGAFGVETEAAPGKTFFCRALKSEIRARQDRPCRVTGV